MKRIFTLIAAVIAGLLFSFSLFAQSPQKDYNIRLHAGNFIPSANAGTLSKNSTVLRNSVFDGRNYVTVQFYSIPSNEEKAQMKTAGIELLDFIPNYAYTASVRSNISPSAFSTFKARSVFQFTPVQKAVPELLAGQIPSHAIKAAGTVDITVITYEKLAAAKVQASFAALNAFIVEEMPMFRRFTVRVPVNKASRIVELSFVQWVEFVEPPNFTENLPGRTLHRVNVLNDGARNLKGDGIPIGIWDEGAIAAHLDFSPVGRVTQVEAGTASLHSSHCAGTILGRGLVNPIARGMAPNATLFSWNFSGNIQTEMAAGIPAHNLVVSSHSYGSGTPNCSSTGTGISYSATAAATDQNLNNFPNHIHCHSAGNSQAVCSGGWYTITSSGKPAKNNIVVADITTTETLSGSSSCGPVADGRIKPEISAMGTSVFSTSNTTSGYSTLSGTSMATPGVAGTCALLVQRFKQLNGNALPPSSLIKNVLLNGARDLGNAGPDYRFGYGRVNALASVKILEENRYVVGSISNAGQVDATISVPAGAARLKVMITWNDPAGAANANPALVNNLDLTVINGATTTLPWILDRLSPATPAVRGVDNISNIEQVTIDNPDAGTYTLRVNGTVVPTGPQQYTLTWSIDQPYLEVSYPNGGESFNPGSNEVITWDGAGVSGNQTLEYSINNGSSWNLISSSVSGTTHRFTWSVPAGVNTSQALIRITNGSLSDVSDATFRILGTTTGFTASGATCNAGEVTFSWNAVTNATHYDIMQLDAASGSFILLAQNLTGTTYTHTGLTPGASMWFHIIAKNNTTNSASNPSNAVNVTVSSGGGGIGTVGPITGQTSICGTPTGVPYSIAAVSGATTYTWTAPPGATIASGQGSTNITINYPAGSTSGNVQVIASAGSCSTAPRTLAVSVGPSAVAAPASGGDQTATHCPPAAMPSLTASATTTAGHTIVWYSAASGGSVVASPVLNAVGTVTYYAAAVHTVSGCESASRTAVTLTINAAPPATITPSGATTFCEGGSVTLTANSGSSYSWSNGASTQSINVTTSGVFTVTVTQTGGCTGISSPVTVTVNPNPAATITASGPTTFCSNSNVTLTASAGSSWLWSNGATGQSINVNSSGTFSVVVTNASGCTATSSSVTTTVSPSPVVTITAAPYSSLFPGLTTTLTATVTPPGTYSYTWFKNGVPVPGAGGPTLTGLDLDDLGSYTVTVNNTTGLPCTSTSPAKVLGDSATTRVFIYPSPNNGMFTVRYFTQGANARTTVSVYDSKGAQVYSKQYNILSTYQELDVDMRRNSAGVYRVVLHDRNGKKLADGSVVIQ